MEVLEKEMGNDLYYVNEDEDIGCFVGCALTDTLQGVISSLAGGYAMLYFQETKSTKPDKNKLSFLKKRREEIAALRRYFSGAGKTYSDIRRWIDIYSQELKEVNLLRERYVAAS
jgi:hypothetical protein